MPRPCLLLIPLLLVGCSRIIGTAGKAKVAAAKSELTSLRKLLERFYLDCGRYPTPAEGLMALSHAPSALVGKWSGPYVGRPVTVDPWGAPYAYRSSGPNAFVLITYGANGALGGTGENADLMVTN